MSIETYAETLDWLTIIMEQKWNKNTAFKGKIQKGEAQQNLQNQTLLID